jgi:hypothetical protein
MTRLEVFIQGRQGAHDFHRPHDVILVDLIYSRKYNIYKSVMYRPAYLCLRKKPK